MQTGGQLGRKFSEVDLAGIGNFLEVDDDACFVRFGGVFNQRAFQVVARGGIAEHIAEFLDAPVDAVIVIEQAHHGNFDVYGLHPLMELVVFNDRKRLVDADLASFLSVFVIDGGDCAVGRYGVKLFGDEQVDVFVVGLEGSHAVGIPADEESRAQRVIAGGDCADIGDAPAAAFARRQKFGGGLELERAKGGLGIGKQTGGQIDADGHCEEEIGERNGQQYGGNFQDAPGAAPAHTLRVVEYGSAFLHEAFQTSGTEGWKSGPGVGAECSIPSALL